jgi:amino acid permease
MSKHQEEVTGASQTYYQTGYSYENQYQTDSSKLEESNEKAGSFVSHRSIGDGEIQTGTKRGLSARHITMISLGGAIG